VLLLERTGVALDEAVAVRLLVVVVVAARV